MNDERSKLQKILDDRMGPRRWAVTGACFMFVGSLSYLYELWMEKPHGGSTAASLGVGALFAAVAVAVETVLRLRIRALDLRDGR